MVSASAVAATVTTLLIGALSDKLGKRKIFICGGYILWGISIVGFALIRMDLITAAIPAVTSAASFGVSLVILMDCLMTFFGSSANDACFNAWLTDATDETNRGKAEGLNAMMPLVAILVVFGSFMSLDQTKADSWTLIFGIIGAVVALLGIVGFFLIRETGVKTGENQNYFANIFYGFRPGVIRSNKKLYLTLAVMAIFNIAIQIFMPYLILYYTEALGMDDYVLIFAPAIVLAAAFTGVYSRIYDRFAFQKAIAAVLGLLLAGCGEETTQQTQTPQQTETTKEAVYVNITAQEAKEVMDTQDGYVILDTRTQEEYDESHIPGAILIPHDQIMEKAESVLTDKDQLILVYCRSGRRSKLASEDLVKLGYTNIMEFGGIIDWPYEVE
jgi:rhodanese-related sulfurtransferase/MFS family permease